MAIHTYECSEGCLFEWEEPATVDMSGVLCNLKKSNGKRCMGVLVLSAAVRTGAPILKRGIGGFHKPTCD